MSTELYQEARKLATKSRIVKAGEYNRWLKKAYKSPEREELLDYARDHLASRVWGARRCPLHVFHKYINRFGLDSELWEGLYVSKDLLRDNTLKIEVETPEVLFDCNNWFRSRGGSERRRLEIIGKVRTSHILFRNATISFVLDCCKSTLQEPEALTIRGRLDSGSNLRQPTESWRLNSVKRVVLQGDNYQESRILTFLPNLEILHLKRRLSYGFRCWSHSRQDLRIILDGDASTFFSGPDFQREHVAKQMSSISKNFELRGGIRETFERDPDWFPKIFHGMNITLGQNT